MVCDGTFAGAAAVLAMNRVWEMPFDVGVALDQWHVIEIVNLGQMSMLDELVRKGEDKKIGVTLR